MKREDVILDWVKVEKPLNFEKNFGNFHPVECEIGFGDGAFLLHKAQSHPDRNYIGIDYSIVSVRKASKKIEKQGLNNVKLIHLDADSAFHLLIPECSLERIYINFPDPWPKKRHEKRRLLDRSFNLLTASRAKKNARMHILTDDPFYRDFILEEVQHYRVWRPVFENGYRINPDGYFQTKYEKKWRSMGKEIYYLEFKKVVHPAVDRLIEEASIPDEVVLPVSMDRLREFIHKPLMFNHSVAKIMGIKEHPDGIKLDVVLKDYTLFQKKNLLVIPESNSIRLIIPEDVFKGKSLELLLKSISEQ
ncbi:tRNA (guanosine(46)-N7)-methyltransferase TrmB [candidate division WOR-3 bacterium]|nr:tRNA (guanosine(46)-N7)-methyltransferase TrmB [candidate division WOR-3 bacterium]